MTRVFIDDLAADANLTAKKLVIDGVEIVRVSPYEPKNKGRAERAFAQAARSQGRQEMNPFNPAPTREQWLSLAKFFGVTIAFDLAFLVLALVLALR